MSSNILYELQKLENINGCFPNIWFYVKPHNLQKHHHIELEDLVNLNTYLTIFQNTNDLPQPMRSHYVALSASYHHAYKAYSQSYQQQQSQAQNYFAQQQNIYQQQQQQYNQFQQVPENQQQYGQSQYPQGQFYSQQQPQYNQPEEQNYYAQQQTQGYQGQPYKQNNRKKPHYQNNAHNSNQNYQHQNYQQNYQQQNFQQQNYPQQNYQQNYQQQNFQQQNYPQQNYQQPSYPQEPNHPQQNYPQQNNTNYVHYTEKKQVQQQTLPIESEDISEEKEVIPEIKIEEIKPKKFSIDEIKNMVKNVNVEELKKSVSTSTLESVQKVNGWKRQLKTLDAVALEPPKNLNNKKSSNYRGKTNYQKPKDNEVKIGTTFKEDTGKAQTFDIKIGANETLETRMERKLLKEKAAERDYVKEKEKQALSLNEIEKARIQMTFSLNKIAPENLKEIFKDLKSFATDFKDTCEALIDLIIEKSWVQPKYAVCYAKLCQYFLKLKETEFQFDLEESEVKQKQEKQGKKEEEKQKKKSNNQFKQILIEKVQQTFDKKENHEDFDPDNEEFKRQYKKKLIGHVEFVGQLIKIKVIQKKIIPYCLAHLLCEFFHDYYEFIRNKDKRHSLYHLQFEAVIRFIENLGERFDCMNEEKKQVPFQPQEFEKNIMAYCQAEKAPQEIKDILTYTSTFKVDDYFKLFVVIDNKILRVKESRLSFLLKNLEERKQNKWEKHHVEAEGPKKLKDIKKDEDINQEQKTKLTIEEAQKDMKSIFINYQEDGDSWKKDLGKMQAKHEPENVYLSFLKLAAEESQNVVAKRLELFHQLLENNFQSMKFQKAWREGVPILAYLASDMPFISALMAKVLLFINAKKNLRWQDYFIKYDPDEQEDEKDFMDLIFQKAYHYETIEEITKFVEPAPKLTKML